MDINFDIKGAKSAGASNSDLSNSFKSNYNIDFDFDGAYKAGASDDEILGYLNQNYGSVKKKVGGAVSVPTPSRLPSKSVLEQGQEMATTGFAVEPAPKPKKPILAQVEESLGKVKKAYDAIEYIKSAPPEYGDT